jgi:carbohydrate kinase (thermoresistant glucokinase family)
MVYRVIFITGVAGSGKTTIGKLLATKTGYSFYDADDFHPQQNIDKMKAGQPLTDEDRWPWLNNIHQFVSKEIISNNIIVACSALKQVYRDCLSKGIADHCRWIFLNGDYGIIRDRMQKRAGHFMPESLLQSQFEILQIPLESIEVDISKSPEEIVNQIILKL